MYTWTWKDAWKAILKMVMIENDIAWAWAFAYKSHAFICIREIIIWCASLYAAINLTIGWINEELFLMEQSKDYKYNIFVLDFHCDLGFKDWRVVAWYRVYWRPWRWIKHECCLQRNPLSSYKWNAKNGISFAYLTMMFEVTKKKDWRKTVEIFKNNWTSLRQNAACCFREEMKIKSITQNLMGFNK